MVHIHTFTYIHVTRKRIQRSCFIFSYFFFKIYFFYYLSRVCYKNHGISLLRVSYVSVTCHIVECVYFTRIVCTYVHFVRTRVLIVSSPLLVVHVDTARVFKI